MEIIKNNENLKYKFKNYLNISLEGMHNFSEKSMEFLESDAEVFCEDLQNKNFYRPKTYENIKDNCHFIISLKDILTKYIKKSKDALQNKIYENAQEYSIIKQGDDDLEAFINFLECIIKMHFIIMKVEKIILTSKNYNEIKTIKSLKESFNNLVVLYNQACELLGDDIKFYHDVDDFKKPNEMTFMLFTSAGPLFEVMEGLQYEKLKLEERERQNNLHLINNSQVHNLSNPDQEKSKKLNLVNYAFFDLKEIIENIPDNFATRGQVQELKREFKKLCNNFKFPLSKDCKIKTLSLAESEIGFIYGLIDEIKSKEVYLDTFPSYLQGESVLD